MPSRLIREGLLESEAVLGLPVEARWLYVSILLSADDLGLFEATPFKLARRADMRREQAEKMLQMLADSDLVRLYMADGRAFGFIPRFGQRLQIKRAKCPLPPDELLSCDEDALKKIKHLASKKTVDHGGSRESTAAQPPEPEPEPKDSVAKATGGKPPVDKSEAKKSPEDMAKAELWRAAVSVLEAGGCPAPQCRTFMGKLVKDYGFQAVQQAVSQAVAEQPADAREYLKATCQRLKGERKDPVTVPSDAADKTAEYLRGQLERARTAAKPPAEVLALVRKEKAA